MLTSSLRCGCCLQEEVLSRLYERVSEKSGGAPSAATAAVSVDSLVATKLVDKLTAALEERGGVEALRDSLARADLDGDGTVTAVGVLTSFARGDDVTSPTAVVVDAGLIDPLELQTSLRMMGIMLTAADTQTLINAVGAKTNPGTGKATQVHTRSTLSPLTFFSPRICSLSLSRCSHAHSSKSFNFLTLTPPPPHTHTSPRV